VAVDVSVFLTNYPEFVNAPTEVVQNCLNDAYSMTPDVVWPSNLVDQAAQLRCAQALALSPFGRGMSYADKQGNTVYDDRLNRLIQIAAAGGSVT